jgi:hypothetical protein
LNFKQKSNQRREESILNTEFCWRTGILSLQTAHTTGLLQTCYFTQTTQTTLQLEPGISKKGICKGRQIHIFEDSKKDQENRFLRVNMHQNGTIMVQGSDAALRSFVEDFPTLRKIAESKKDKDSPLTSLLRDTNSTSPGPDLYPHNRSILPPTCLQPT